MFLSTAHAQDTAPVTPEKQVVAANLVPFLLIIVIFYFLMIRPQQKKYKAHQATIQGLKRGDKIVTAGGIIGTITKVDSEAIISVEIAPGVTVQVARQTVMNVASTEEKQAATPEKKKNEGGSKKQIANDN